MLRGWRMYDGSMAGTVVVFAGEYDLATQDRLRQEFLEVHKEPELVIDLTEVSYVDSSFVTELVRLHRRRHEEVLNPEVIVLRHPMVRRLFDILSLENIFRVVETLDEALAHNGKTMSVRYAFSGDDGLESCPLPYKDSDSTLT